MINWKILNLWIYQKIWKDNMKENIANLVNNYFNINNYYVEYTNIQKNS